MPGTGNLTLDGAGWKGPISVQANKRIHIAHQLALRPEWCAVAMGTAAPQEDLVGLPLLADTQRVQNGISTPFGYHADLYIRVIDSTDVQRVTDAPAKIGYIILD